MKTNFETRYAAHPEDAKAYQTDRLRKDFLVEKVFTPNEINMTYSMYDRMIVGGAFPTKGALKLEAPEEIRAKYFLERRELGIFNVGGSGVVVADGVKYDMELKEALYIGMGTKSVTFESKDTKKPAKFYFLSTPAHKTCPSKLIKRADADVAELGSLEESNHRFINKLIVNQVLETCQLQMGMTELQPGSVWNTMPVHIHDRRMEAYFYFGLPENQAICHFMGEPQETRHIWMHNEQAVLSPEWSIHSAAGTSSYTFIWGMGGENIDYGDQDWTKTTDIK